MVARNKFYKIIDRYRAFLKKNSTRSTDNKNKILDFYLKNNRWPYKNSQNEKERKLGLNMENYISKKNGCYDSKLRRIVLVTGRKPTNKREHDVRGFKTEILEFLKEHGRAPSTSYEYQIIEGEARLGNKLDYYTQKKNDMSLLGKVYAVDKCHKSGIQAKYRKLINESLDVDKPLIRLI
jgi:hypothetical protein